MTAAGTSADAPAWGELVAGPSPRHAAGDPRALADWVHERWYGGTGAHDARGAVLAAALRAAHAASGRFLPGWTVTAVLGGGALAVRQGGQRRVVGPGAYLRLDRPGLPAGPGDEVAVEAFTARTDAGGRTWCAWGRGAGATADPVLVFWSAQAADAPEVVAVLTRHLERARRPYALSAPTCPGAYERPGALVLTLDAATFPGAAPPLRAALAEMDGLLAPATPPLALTLAPGCALGEPAPGGPGFARHRAAAVASGLAAADRRGVRGLRRAGLVRAALAAWGIEPDRPHLLRPARRDYGLGDPC